MGSDDPFFANKATIVAVMVKGTKHDAIYIYIHGENVCSFVKKTSIHNIVLCFLNFKHPFAFGKKKTLHPLFI